MSDLKTSESGEAAAPSEMQQFTAAINAKYRLHVAAFEAGDPEPILQHFFTADALWEYHGYPRREGREQLRRLFDEVIRSDRVAVQSIRSYVNGDNGWDYADYTVTPRDTTKSAWVFRQIFCWVRIEGEWLVNACIGFIPS